MSEQTAMAGAVAAAQAAFEADPIVAEFPPGTPARRDRMRAIIAEVAAVWEVERMELTMALAQGSARPN
ncbi:hypothetical protein [Roseomonas sp. WA12]